MQKSFYERQGLNDVCGGMQLSFSGHHKTEVMEPGGAQHDRVEGATAVCRAGLFQAQPLLISRYSYLETNHYYSAQMC